jgi:hypothetical protein
MYNSFHYGRYPLDVKFQTNNVSLTVLETNEIVNVPFSASPTLLPSVGSPYKYLAGTSSAVLAQTSPCLNYVVCFLTVQGVMSLTDVYPHY